MTIRLVLLLVLCCGGMAQAQSLSGRASLYYHFSRAKMLELEGDYSAAVKAYEKVLELDPESAQVRVELARTLTKSGHIRRAVEEAEKATRLDPANLEAYLLLGEIYYRFSQSEQGNMIEQALAAFRKVTELDPSHQQALFALGRLYLIREQYPQAAEAFGRFLQLEPAVPRAYYFRAYAQERSGDLEGAVQTLEQALEQGWESVDVLKLLGSYYERQERIPEAARLYGMALAYEPDSELQARFARLADQLEEQGLLLSLLAQWQKADPENLPLALEYGKVLRRRRQLDQALEILNRVLQADPDNPEARFEWALTRAGMGQRREGIQELSRLLEESEDPALRSTLKTHLALLFQESKDYDRAVQLFQEVVEDSPQNYRARLGLILALKDAERVDEALQRSRELLQLMPHNLWVVMTHAQVLGAAGRVEEAMEGLEKVMGENSAEEDLYVVAAQIYSDRRLYQKAEQVLERGLQHLPESERLRFQLAAVYERQKEYDLAEVGFRQILAKNPDHSGVLNYLGYMLTELGVRLEEAKGYIERAVQLDPYNGAYLDSLGWVCFKLNQLERAEQLLLQAAALNEGDPTILEHLGDLYSRSGELEKALRYYQDSLRQAEEEEQAKAVQSKLNALMSRLAEKAPR